MTQLALSPSSSGTGSITLIAPITNNTRLLNLPDSNGTLVSTDTPGGPAFSAYLGTNQSITNTAWTKVSCNVEEFDTANMYDTSLYRFTPTIAGYYNIIGEINNSASASYTSGIVAIYKNGSLFKRGSAGNINIAAHVSCLVYFNGTTDYVEMWTNITASSAVVDGGLANTYFQGFLVRNAL